MRFVLTPIAEITWANLNHTLCSLPNDPFDSFFGMGKWYFLWAEIYLGLSSILMNTVNTIAGYIIFKGLPFAKQKML
jgi:hypothetical protein